ncbi:hypothetical protein E7T09_20340 [Deinococcus sp. KSM4-11]|uniref:hypothetical protein n=1 Tax=Deinococcus sp. KSM4-11 TaxID=2568654 RepID=UPI0010A2FEA7|nr:hypothetical protein [Deinococcus sp. KSM4-11]THF84360.1 hypothetical protein E7T09_20340 [Deinococcus sp. KSM4-11]
MNSIVRNVQALGLDLSLQIHFDGSCARAAVAFEGRAPQGSQLHAQNSCTDSAVHELMSEVNHLAERVYQEYRAAHLQHWTAQLVSPIGANLQLSVFDHWLLEKLMTRCLHFQLGWTPLPGHQASFRFLCDDGRIWVQVMSEKRHHNSCTNVVETTDIHSLMNAVRALLDQLDMAAPSAEAAD